MMHYILKKYRQASGIKQPDMAAMLGIPYRTYQSYEELQTQTAKNIDSILFAVMHG